MDISCIYFALNVVITSGTQLGFLVFLKILIELLRPDILDVENRVKPVSAPNTNISYDFIIIGAGSAGSVLANRLTENPQWKVLLLEAGGDETVIGDVPAVATYLQKTDEDWQFKTEPSDNYCLGMNNNQCLWSRGKALGGSSAINSMMYVRGNRKDYDHWSELGNSEWSYNKVLPYFKKSENMRIRDLKSSPYHGVGGYLTVEHVKYTSAAQKYFLNAGRDLGYAVRDLNGESQEGFMPVQGTLRDGLRCSTAKAFLRPASHRKNLYVSINSMVWKILIDESTKTAYGVQFSKGGQTYSVHAKKEVILSAGAIQSPQILMLSGVGPSDHLEEMGINVIHGSPGVGQNLQDHVAMGGLVTLADMPVPSGVSVPAIQQFLDESNGPLYGIDLVDSMAFVSTKYANGTPDIQLILGAGSQSGGGGFVAKQYFGLKDDFFESLFGNILNNNTYTITTLLLRPKSRGHIKLRSTNPNHRPIIVPNYFNDTHDLDVLIEGAKIAYKISQTPTMRALNARPNRNVIPQCAHFAFYSDDYLRCHARHYTLTIWHPTCTCKMGPKSDNMAVVDPELKVHGVNGLRVVDASVMAKIVSGNTNAPTIMIAEKAADLMKAAHKTSALKLNRRTVMRGNRIS